MKDSEPSNLPFDEKSRSKVKSSPGSLPQLVDESSQTTETTATVTISTLPSFSESKGQNRQQSSDIIPVIETSRICNKIGSLQDDSKDISPKRLFQAKAEDQDNDGDDILFSSNDSKSTGSILLPQEKLNELPIASLESSDMTSDQQHLKYLREKVEQQVQSISQLLESSSTQQQQHKHGGSMAMQQFHALSSQVVADFLEDPNEVQTKRRRTKSDTPQSSEKRKLQLMEARREIEELQRQLIDQEKSTLLLLENDHPQVVLLHQQRSKLQRRIRELRHDIAELRQERNSYETQCLEQSRRILSMEDSMRQLEEEKKESEDNLHHFISALQGKSTDLLEELQQARRLLQHETQSKIEASTKDKQRIATLETENRRLQRMTTDLGRTMQDSTTDTINEDDDLSVLPNKAVISNIESISRNDRLEEMRSDVEQRRAKIEAIRQRRNAKDPSSENSIPDFLTHPIFSGPLETFQDYESHLYQEKTANAQQTIAADGTEHALAVRFLERIDAAMERGASSFANHNAVLDLEQEIVDLKYENVQLKLEIQEVEDNAAALEGDLTEQEGLISKLSGDLRGASNQVVAAEESLRQQEEGKSMEATIDDLSKQFEATLPAAKDRQLNIKKKLEISNADLKRANSEVTKLVEELESIRTETNTLRAEKGRQAMELEHSEQVQKELAKRLAAAEFALKEQAKRAAFQDEELSRLMEKCLGIEIDAGILTADGESTSSEGGPLVSTFSSFSNELSETSERRTALERQLRDLHSQFQSFGQFDGESSGSNMESGLKNVYLCGLDRAIAKLRMECDQFATQNTYLQGQNEALKELLLDSENVRDKLENELEMLRKDYAVTEANVTALQDERKKLTKEIEAHSSVQVELETRLADASRLIDSALPRIKYLEGKVVELSDNVTGRDIVLKELEKEKIALAEKVEALSHDVEFWKPKSSNLKSELEVKTKSGDNSESLVALVKDQLIQLSDIKVEVMQQLFQTAGNVDYRSTKSELDTPDVVADIKDIHFVLETARQFIVASRETSINQDRKIATLRDEKSLFKTRNAALERIIDEQRVQSNEFEQLLSTTRFVLSDGSAASVAVQSRGVQTGDIEEGKATTSRSTEQDTTTAETNAFQSSKKVNIAADLSQSEQWSEEEYFRRIAQDTATPKIANKASTAFSQTIEEGEEDSLAQREQVQEEHRLLRSFNSDDKESFVSRSMSPISEINTNDDVSNPSWTEISEVDSKNDSLKHFPPSDDISELSQSSTNEPLTSVIWMESEVATSYSISAQPPSSQLETLASVESFGQLITPRVANSAHSGRHPPEYNITLGALSSTKPSSMDRYPAEPSPIDRYAIEESSEFGKRKNKFFDF